jgi:PPOX class probable F420-dependent enzyme
LKLTKEAKALMQGKNFANVATINADGSPQVTPVWIDSEGDLILVNTTNKRLKWKNAKRDPRVALSVFDQDDPYRRILVKGKVVGITKEGADEHIDKLSLKYTGHKYKDRQPGADRVLLKIAPIHITEQSG